LILTKDISGELIREQETPNNNAAAAEQKPRRSFQSSENRLESTMAIRLTPTASKRVRSFLEKEGGIGLRLGVRKTGCSGWAYTVELAKDIEQGDIVFEQENDLKVVVASDNLAFLDGSTIDFVAQGLTSTFLFDNPNVTDECGCGESFTIS
jgi:iron-sulfur cluster assembly protein